MSKPAAPFGAFSQLQGMDPDELMEQAARGMALIREIQAKAWAEGCQCGKLTEKGMSACKPYK